jgi:hypothetical protein
VTHCDVIMSRLPTNNLLSVGVKKRPSTSGSLPFRGLAVRHGLLSPAALKQLYALKRTRKSPTILSAGTVQLLAHCTAHARLLCRCSDSLLGEYVLIQKLLMLSLQEANTRADIVHISLYYISETIKEFHVKLVLYVSIKLIGRSKWPCGLRHEQSSLVRTLGSWFRIPYEACKYVCV